MQEIVRGVKELEWETVANRHEHSEKARVWQLMKLEVGKGLKVTPQVKYFAQVTTFSYFS